jgi:hypothetical protein
MAIGKLLSLIHTFLGRRYSRPLVDVALDDRNSGQNGEVWRRKKREASVTKEKGERGYPKYGTKRSQRNKEGLR